ncbi:exo-alpha-sialidase [bacterium]|nr:exo-alpha-sialidase [bacterium]
MSFRFTLAELDAKAKLQPQMTDVFTEGVAHDGYPRIRIPAIVATKKGTLLAFAEGRQGGDHSKNDMILKRSTDGGKTWNKVQVLADEGGDCINNPQPVVLTSGRVLLVYQVFPENIHARAIGKTVKVAEPGLDGPRVQKCTLIHSDDDGVTWSKPRDITAGTKPPTRAVALASGPGVGIVLRRGQHKGRIVMPFNNTWYQGGGARRFTVYAAWSDDQGETWKFGQPAPEGKTGDGNEVQMVELTDGSLLLNSRSFSAKFRKIALSRDGGDTWTPLADAPTLIEPRCQGSILRYTDPLDGKKSRILFANPASQEARVNGTIRLSYDEGKTWPVAKTLYAGGYAYSCLVALPDGAIGCLFERDAYKHITFARFTLEWLTDGRDKSE